MIPHCSLDLYFSKNKRKIRSWHLVLSFHGKLKGKVDAKAETPVLWPPHAKSLLIEKDSDPGRD